MTEHKPKRLTKSARENAVFASDRVQLIDAANQLVGHIINKQTLPKLHGNFFGDIELQDCEAKAYESALNFLSRQFETGFKEPEAIPSRVEWEEAAK